MAKYRCKVCGAEVEVEEGQPCPICGAPFENLEKIED